MSVILGIDTSNYTTSCAIYNTQTGVVTQRKKLLPVKAGECGIRQSDAVFHHTRQLPELIESLFADSNEAVDAVCVSTTPRMQEGSYMPCFTVGQSAAKILSSTMKIPMYTTSHQQGHIVAALYSADRLDLLTERFLAFHVSGGTTEAILVAPCSNKLIGCEIVGKTLDLNAGQLIDRTGVMMGLQFPCGKELEALASQYNKGVKVKPVLKDFDCCLSGFENKLRDIYSETQDKSATAAYAIAYIEATVSAMTERLLDKLGSIPVVYAGGVMSDTLIQNSLKTKFNCDFATPEFSCDNAAGVAIIGGYMHKHKYT